MTETEWVILDGQESGGRGSARLYRMAGASAMHGQWGYLIRRLQILVFLCDCSPHPPTVSTSRRPTCCHSLLPTDAAIGAAPCLLFFRVRLTRLDQTSFGIGDRTSSGSVEALFAGRVWNRCITFQAARRPPSTLATLASQLLPQPRPPRRRRQCQRRPHPRLC